MVRSSIAKADSADLLVKHITEDKILWETRKHFTGFKPDSDEMVPYVLDRVTSYIEAAGLGPEDELFPVNADTLSNWIMRLMIGADVDKTSTGRLGIHRWRASMACEAAMNGENDEVIAAGLGHKGTGNLPSYHLTSNPLPESTGRNKAGHIGRTE